MKRLISLFLILTVSVLCVFPTGAFAEETQEFRGLNDSAVREYIEESLYDELVGELGDSDYYVSNIQTIYISQEYIDELEYNSRKNVYFGYSLEDLDAQFQGTRYVFTLGENGETIVRASEGYDDTYDRIIRNVAVGTGVILICVTVSVLTAGTADAAAVSMIFAVAAKTGAAGAASGAVLGGVSSGIVQGIQTGDMDQALKAAALGASEGFKWGAITGAVSGGISEGAALHGATLNGLSMNEAAMIQRESKLPLSFIKYMHSMEEYNVYKSCGLEALNLNGTLAYAQSVDLTLVDEYGRTNAERILENLSPIDSEGIPFELHHIGQAADSPLAILTQSQHRGTGNFSILHLNTGSVASEIDREVFAAEKNAFWLAYLAKFGGV